MKINSLNLISQAIRRNIFISLLSLLIPSLLIVNILYYKNHTSIERHNQNELIANFDLLKSHISEKISIIASSSIFVDYLRSGYVTQKILKSDFLFVVRSLKLKEITGIKIKNSSGENIFSDGNNSSYYVELPLCYFDRELDSKLGACAHTLILYFDKNEIVKSLRSINDNLIYCKNCKENNFLSDNKFGSFKIVNTSGMPVALKINDTSGFYILIINILIFIFMFILANWTWKRTHYILETYLSNPLKIITGRLKSGSDLENKYEIDELAYLVDQIQNREARLKRLKRNENLINLGEVASQVAHDMRSPLAVINVLLQKNTTIPEDQRKLILSASQQLNDIADNVLLRFRNELGSNTKECHRTPSSDSYVIAELLETTLKEKQTQYDNLLIDFNYMVDENAKNVTVDLIGSDFKRVISNIINNAVEAINGSGVIKIKLLTSDKVVKIAIRDSGSGIPEDVISKIMNGQSISKKPNGSGIGLASSYKFIKSWGGNLEIKSTHNLGTSIIISIPIKSTDHSLVINNYNLLKPDLILIDDNQSIIEVWKLAALHNNKTIAFFKNIKEAKENVKKYSLLTPIFLDSDLQDEIKGEVFAKELYELGFINIYLATGHPKDFFKPMYWIKSIVSKKPNFDVVY